jgi:hypothetical protein
MATSTASTRKQSRRKYQADDIMERIICAGLSLTRDGGLYEVTAANLARAVQIREQALVNLVGGVYQLRDWITVRALRDLTEHLSQAIRGLAGRAAIEAFISTQRLYAQAHPHMHEAALMRITILTPDALDAMEAYAALELNILKAYGVPATHAATLGWCLRAMVRGATGLEAADRLTHPHEIDQNFEQLTSLYESAARSGAAATVKRQAQKERRGDRPTARRRVLAAGGMPPRGAKVR